VSEHHKDGGHPDPSTSYALDRRRRLRRIKRLVDRSAYDVPADEVAVSIIRDALSDRPHGAEQG
jgi:hypothetical protein